MLYTGLTILFLLIITVVEYIYFNNRHSKDYKIKDAYLKYTIENIPTGLCFRNLHGKIILSNKEFAKLTGYTQRELYKKDIWNIYPKEFYKTINKTDNQIIKTKKSITFEKIISFKKNLTHYYKIIKMPIIDKNMDACGFVIILKNIDKEKEIERGKESFIATLIHDLKTPTFAQINTLGLMLKGNFGQLNSTQKEMIELLKKSSEYVKDLVTTILDTYRYENGEIRLNFEEFDIVELISTMCKGIKNLADEKKQNIIFVHKSENCNLKADKLQIKRVIFNLLNNAITYGHKSTDIIVKIEQKAKGIECTVTNKSERITEKELSTMFKRFKKTQLSHFNKTSTGLGLYISKQIIDMHGGEIFVRSLTDGTCIFGFEIKKKQEIIPNNASKIFEKNSL